MSGKRTGAAIGISLLVTGLISPPAFARALDAPPSSELALESTWSEAETTAPPAVLSVTTVADQAEESHATASSSGSVVDLDVLGQEALTVSESSSSAGQSSSGGSSSGSSSSKATLLSVLGHELWGAEADSKKGSNEREGLLLDVTDQICAGSGGQLCVGLLYEERKSSEKDGNSEEKSIASVCAGGDQNQASHDCDGPVSLTVGYAGASAHEDEDGTESSSDTSLVDACIGSGSHSVSDTCDGPVGARVAESHSDSSSKTDANGNDKSAESGAENSGAEVCVGGEDPESGMCDGVGTVVLHSESRSSANTQGESKNEGRAHLVAIEAEGEEQFAIDQEGDLSVPPECPPQSVVCLFLNSVASDAEAGKAGGRATAIAAEVGKGILGDSPILRGTVDDSNSGVELGDRVKGTRFEQPKAPGRPGGGPITLGAPAPRAGLLPFTGFALPQLLTLGLMMLLLGKRLMRGARPNGLW